MAKYLQEIMGIDWEQRYKPIKIITSKMAGPEDVSSEFDMNFEIDLIYKSIIQELGYEYPIDYSTEGVTNRTPLENKRLAMRYEKSDSVFLSFIALAAIMIII